MIIYIYTYDKETIETLWSIIKSRKTLELGAHMKEVIFGFSNIQEMSLKILVNCEHNTIVLTIFNT